MICCYLLDCYCRLLQIFILNFNLTTFAFIQILHFTQKRTINIKFPSRLTQFLGYLGLGGTKNAVSYPLTDFSKMLSPFSYTVAMPLNFLTACIQVGEECGLRSLLICPYPNKKFVWSVKLCSKITRKFTIHIKNLQQFLLLHFFNI